MTSTPRSRAAYHVEKSVARLFGGSAPILKHKRTFLTAGRGNTRAPAQRQLDRVVPMPLARRGPSALPRLRPALADFVPYCEKVSLMAAASTSVTRWPVITGRGPRSVLRVRPRRPFATRRPPGAPSPGPHFTTDRHLSPGSLTPRRRRVAPARCRSPAGSLRRRDADHHSKTATRAGARANPARRATRLRDLNGR